ncbi:hypothetical protein Glove_712g41 [Diversispora epigaea]|uniref:Uncharacterized protein n=1 Tax=Diversispora epigaea TaxID=1348612 RepID=A0A397G3Q3_9GLOM|nr:hypothetical protein Glove_712g41 [Diversispora epigaea]
MCLIISSSRRKFGIKKIKKFIRRVLKIKKEKTATPSINNEVKGETATTNNVTEINNVVTEIKKDEIATNVNITPPINNVVIEATNVNTTPPINNVIIETKKEEIATNVNTTPPINNVVIETKKEEIATNVNTTPPINNVVIETKKEEIATNVNTTQIINKRTTRTIMSNLNSDDPQYIEIEKLFHSGLPNQNIFAIIHLQMPTKKVEIHEEYKKTFNINSTHRMFHGTKNACNPELLVTQENDYSFCKSGCGMCGIIQNGNQKKLSKHSSYMWFADNSITSNGYVGSTEIKAMFVVDIISPIKGSVLTTNRDRATLPRYLILFKDYGAKPINNGITPISKRTPILNNERTRTIITSLNFNNPQYIEIKKLFHSGLSKQKIFSIMYLQMPTKLIEVHEEYKKLFKANSTHRMFHGTRTACNSKLLVTQRNNYSFCKSGCGMCGIIQNGNQTKLSKYSSQMWFADNSFTSNGYVGTTEIKAMFVVDIVSPVKGSVLIIDKDCATLPRYLILYQN